MSQDLELSPAERRARDLVRAMPRPEADAAYRERLERDFVTGRIGVRRALELGGSGRRSAWRWLLAPVVAVALVVAAITLDRTPGWEAAATMGQGTLSVDGRSIPAGSAEVARRLHAGARVHTSVDVTLRLASAGFGMIEVTPGSDVTLPAPPGRWFHRSVQAEVQGGVVRFSTAPAFRGARLAVRAPDALAEITGTTFAVLAMPVGTCVCVYEGRVAVGATEGTMVMVPAGQRREIFNNGQAPRSDRILSDQMGPLRALREECARTMPKGR